MRLNEATDSDKFRTYGLLVQTPRGWAVRYHEYVRNWTTLPVIWPLSALEETFIKSLFDHVRYIYQLHQPLRTQWFIRSMKSQAKRLIVVLQTTFSQHV